MIKLTDKVDCTQSVYNARIYTQWIAYKDLPHAPYFYRTDGGTLLSYCDGVLTIDGELFDSDELNQFIRMCGCHTVVCGEQAANKLNVKGRYTSASVMRYAKGHIEFHSRVETSPKLDDVFALLYETFENMQAAVFERWYCDVSIKIRRGLAYVYGIYDESFSPPEERAHTLSATAGVYYQNPHTAVIGSVATRLNQRGKGFATQILHALVERILSEGRLPQIIALNEHAYQLYQNIGFEEAGKYFEITLE